MSKRKKKREKQAKTQTLNCREQPDGYQRGGNGGMGTRRWALGDVWNY